jgi:gas vesicle protein
MADVFEKHGDHASGSGFMLGLLTGTVLGAGLGMLLAPKRGSELRSQIGEHAGSLGRAAGEHLRRAADAAKNHGGRAPALAAGAETSAPATGAGESVQTPAESA